jgi:predicted GTPase
MGAAGRDFHDFNVVFRKDRRYEVVAFTAAQIPNITGRRYPAALAGPLYPRGIPIRPEADLATLIGKHHVREVVFAYSDVPYPEIMAASAVANAGGADFRLLGGRATMLESRKPVVSVCAVRTGAGKSQTTRHVAAILRDAGLRVAVVRHPMPYGNLVKQRLQRFATSADLSRQRCTIEEREEYEPHIEAGSVVYAGVDYGDILRSAEREADVVLWDGGNNDLPFYVPDLHIVIADALRVGNELSYYPGEANLRMADIALINKIDSADLDAINTLRANIRRINPTAPIVEAASPIEVDHSELIAGKRVLVVEDGPTVTHGGMRFGAGTVAAMKHGATLVDPKPYTVGTITETFETYPHMGPLLPAMGYGEAQVADLEATIARVPCDAVVIGTPADLTRLLSFDTPTVRVRYRLQEIGTPVLADLIGEWLARRTRQQPRRSASR